MDTPFFSFLELEPFERLCPPPTTSSRSLRLDGLGYNMENSNPASPFGGRSANLYVDGSSPTLEEQMERLLLAEPNCSPLPSDVVCLILEYGASVDARSSSSEIAERRRHLRQASLVCSVWRGEAQRLLWQHVVLDSNERMRRLLSSTRNDHRTLFLRFEEEYNFDFSSPLHGGLVEKVLARVRGLESLELSDIHSLPATSLCAPSLRGKTSLGTAAFGDR